MEQTNIVLEVLDTPIVEQTKFDPDMKRWLSNVVDIINASFSMIQNSLNALFAIGQENFSGFSVTVSVPGLTSNSYVSVSIVPLSVSLSNPVNISNISVGVGSFTVNFSANSTPSGTIVYQCYAWQPS